MRGHHVLHPGIISFAERLAEKLAVAGEIAVGKLNLSGDQDDLDRWPALMDRLGESKAVHAAGHLDIREQQGDVGAGFEDGHSLVGIHGLDRGIARIRDHIDGAHAQHHLVFDDQDIRNSQGNASTSESPARSSGSGKSRHLLKSSTAAC